MKKSRYKNKTDAELLQYYLTDKDSEWLGILLERYTLLLYGVCMKYLKDEHLAQDAVQQIFLKVLTEAGKYRIDYFKSWLYMVAKNHCLMALRDKKSRVITEITDLNQPPEEEREINPHEKELTFDLMEASLRQLNEEQKQCVILFYLEKNSYQQVAEKTGFSTMQVKSFIQNGKRNLKINLQRKLDELESKKHE